MRAREYQEQLVAGQMTETALQAQVEAVARTLGWRAYHTRDSRRSESGFPDLVLVRPPRLIFAELKRQSAKSQPTAEQQAWLDDVNAVGDAISAELLRRMTDDELRTPGRLPGVEAYLWRPIDMTTKTITEVLR